MAVTHRRIEREHKTVEAMTRIFCRDRHHGGNEPCPECSELLAYAGRRLDKCPFGEMKPACANCPIPCYKPGMRERIRSVMRYAGPRMVWRHPVLAVFHLFDARRKAPLAHAPKAGREITLDN
ncbi:MAG TPA: nitrous oxide-stimulated promoter family protein [Syntrophales bacterium]|nr:nitrous oxide-stimulated promoter family protein [Syntrophales bacterium]